MTDLPKPENRWLINATTGFIEAWDHAGNPESGNDMAALLLCIKALGKEDWDHPSYTRKETAAGIASTFAFLWRTRILCEHSACEQNYIDTGSTECLKKDPFEGIMEGVEMMPIEMPEEPWKS